MKRKIYLPLVAAAFVSMASLNGCKQQQQLGAGIDPANMDTTVIAGNDFYHYACGGWIQAHPLTPEYSRFGSFEYLGEQNLKQIRELIEGIAASQNEPGSIEQKIGDLYRMAMDSTKRNNDKAEPIKADLSRIASLDSKDLLPAYIGEMQRSGVSLFFQPYVGADEKDSRNNLFQIYQGGLSLGEKDYYTNQDEHSKEIRAKYLDYAKDMFKLSGNDDKTAQRKADAVLNIETKIAEGSKSATELRDPYSNYNKMSYADFKTRFAGFNWDNYTTALGIDSINEINVCQTKQIETVIGILGKSSLDDIKAYLEFKLLESASSYLSDDFYDTSFAFYGKVLSGREAPAERWKRSIRLVDGTLSDAVGQMYVKQYFPPEAKERMLTLVANLQTALGERIDQQTWMSDETKAKAHEKLNAFTVKIGYPDKWRDYSALDINQDSFWENMKRANQFEYDHMLSKANKPVDRTEWLMPAQMVNAYYNPTTNEICFPAAILQYPFFDMNADDAFNYGAIGVVIGHEMTHGFDDQGSLYDKDGNLNNWWTKEDSVRFHEKTRVMEEFFDSIEVLPGLNANGKLTLGENIADHGGIKVAYQAYKNATKDNPLPVLEGFTADQRFFIAYANLWAASIRDEQIRVATMTDPHALGEWRVNGALPQIDAWYEAFGITESDSMYIPKAERVDVW